MRSYHSFLLPSALLAAAILFAQPAFAQQAVSTPDAAPSGNQSPLPPPTVSPPYFFPQSGQPVLVIPMPPGGKLRVEMDARSEDLLGMVKSFLKGIGEESAAEAAQTGKATPNPIADALDAGNLADTLKDVNHVHFVVYELPGLPPTLPTLPFTMPGKPPVKTAKVMPAPSIVLPLPPPAPDSGFDSNAFYESAFAAEGAHRILYTDADAYKLVMVGFPDRKGYAFAVSGAGYVAVSRSDGYPNFEALSAFVSHITSAAMNSKMVKDAVSGAMGGDKGDTGGKPDDKK